jgi:transcriptional regulator with XRE-family HTH domain
MNSLRLLREASGLSQYAAANGAGLDRTRLSLAENGHVQLSAEEDAAIRRVLLRAIRERAARINSVLAASGAEPVRGGV